MRRGGRRAGGAGPVAAPSTASAPFMPAAPEPTVSQRLQELETLSGPPVRSPMPNTRPSARRSWPTFEEGSRARREQTGGPRSPGRAWGRCVWWRGEVRAGDRWRDDYVCGNAGGARRLRDGRGEGQGRAHAIRLAREGCRRHRVGHLRTRLGRPFRMSRRRWRTSARRSGSSRNRAGRCWHARSMFVTMRRCVSWLRMGWNGSAASTSWWRMPVC